MSTWIDFKELRAKLTFEQLLRHYGVEPKIKGKQHHGYCPLPNHNGKRNSPSFSANLEKGIFQCFGCGAKGNLLEFAAMMENVDPKDGAAFRKVAGGLQRKFCPELANSAGPGGKVPEKKQPEAKPKEDVSAIVNHLQYRVAKRILCNEASFAFCAQTLAAFQSCCAVTFGNLM